MPRIAKAALAALAAAVLALVGTWILDITYLRYGADITYSGYVPETPPPPPPTPAPTGTRPDASAPAAASSAGTLAPPRETHPGVVIQPSDAGLRAAPADAGVVPPSASDAAIAAPILAQPPRLVLPTSPPIAADAGVRRAMPSLAPLLHRGDGGMFLRPFGHGRSDGGVPAIRPPFARNDGGTPRPFAFGRRDGDAGARRQPFSLRRFDGGVRAPYTARRLSDGGVGPRPQPSGVTPRPRALHNPNGPAHPPTTPATATTTTAATPATPTTPRPISNAYLSTIVDRRVERAAQLFTVVRAQARVMNAWDFLRLGPMLERPKILVRIRARLRLDRTGSWRFEVRGGGRGVLTLDGVVLATAPQKPSAPIPLARGEHDFDLAWRIEEASDRLVTYASVGTAPFRSLNTRAFRPPPDVRDDPRWRAWAIGIACAALAALLAGWTFGARDRLVSARRGALSVALVIVLSGVTLRVWDYDVVPQYGQIGDELFVTWNGWSMIAEGKTRGWSLWPEHYAPYVDIQRLRYVGTDWQAITPYFEHPPLMHLIVGGVAHLSGARHYLEARITYTRIVPLVLSSILVVLVMLLARRFDRRPAVVLTAGALGAFLPVLAIQARLLKEDHLLAIFLVGAVLASMEWLEKRRAGWLFLAAVLAGLAPLAKIPGVASIAAVFCIAWAGGGLRAGLGTLLVSVPIASLVLVHGAMFGWDSFVRQTLIQGTIRGGTWSIFVNWFEFARIGDNDVGRGWLLFLWFGYFTGFPKSRLDRVTYTLPVFLHMTATALASNWMYGWYLLPIFPFLCVGAARSIAAAWTESDGWRPFVLTALGPMYTLQLMPPVMNVYFLKFAVTAVVLVLFTPLVVHTVVRTRFTAGLVRTVIVVGFGALLATSVAYIVTYDTAVLSAASFDAQLRR